MSDTAQPTRTLAEYKRELALVAKAPAKAVGARIDDFFEFHKGAIASVSKRYITPDRLLSIAKGAIRQTPKLQECSVASLFGAIIICAQMGLEPNTHKGHCWLIPRANSRPKKDPDTGRILTEKVDGKDRWIWERTWEVNVQIGYQGHIELAYRSPRIKLIKAVLVHENDKIRILEGSAQRIEHEVDARRDRGEIIGVYGIAKLDTGEVVHEWLSRAEVDEIRDRYSDAYKSAVDAIADARGRIDRARTEKELDTAKRKLEAAEATPWIANYPAMAKKSAVHRLKNYLPKTEQMELAQAVADRETARTGQHFGEVLDGVDYTIAGLEEEAEPEEGPKGIEQSQGGMTLDDLKGKEGDKVSAGQKQEESHGETQKETREETRNEPVHEDASKDAPGEDPAADWLLALGLSTRAVNVIRQADIASLDALLALDPSTVREMEGCGTATANMILKALEPHRAPRITDGPVVSDPPKQQEQGEPDAARWGDVE